MWQPIIFFFLPLPISGSLFCVMLYALTQERYETSYKHRWVLVILGLFSLVILSILAIFTCWLLSVSYRYNYSLLMIGHILLPVSTSIFYGRETMLGSTKRNCHSSNRLLIATTGIIVSFVCISFSHNSLSNTNHSEDVQSLLQSSLAILPFTALLSFVTAAVINRRLPLGVFIIGSSVYSFIISSIWFAVLITAD